MASSAPKKSTPAIPNAASKTAPQQLNESPEVHQHQVSLLHRRPVKQKEALKNIGNWRSIMRPLMGNNFLRGFYIPHDDYAHLKTKYPHAKGVRAYFAILDPRTVGSVHLYIVPVDEFGNDIIDPAAVDLQVDDDASSAHDFTQPCPNQCDYGSPYYEEK